MKVGREKIQMYPSLCVENFFLRNDTYTVLEEFRESTVK